MKKFIVTTMFVLVVCGGVAFAGGVLEESERTYEDADMRDTAQPRETPAPSGTEEEGGRGWKERIEDEKDGRNWKARITSEKQPEPQPKQEQPEQQEQPKPVQQEQPPVQKEADRKETEPEKPFFKNAAGVNAFYELWDEELYIALQYTRMLLPWLGLNVELALSLYYSDFCGTGGIVFDFGSIWLLLNAGYDTYMGFVVHPMLGFELWRFLFVIETGFCPEYDFVDGFRAGLGVHFLF